MLQRRMPGRLMGSVPLWGGGLSAFKFDPLLTTFTPNMDKRAAPGPFETAPIVQGMFDGSGVPDTIIFDRGDPIHDNFYANIDGHQGSVTLWWTPEKDRDATQIDPEYIWYDLSGKYHLVYEHDNQRFTIRAGEGSDVGYVSHTSVAGAMVHLVFRWDTKNTLDGTNYFSLSINNVHTFVVPGLPTQATPGSSLYVGSEGFFFPANAIIEGLTVYRRPLFDGTNGVAANWDDSGPIDEIEEIYAAGAGQDPCLITGSWGVVFCLPTNSTAEALVTGTGEAWSHPHASGVLEHQWLEDGGYLGSPWAVKGNGSNTNINCGSGATLDDIPDGAQMTIEGWFKIFATGGTICKKGNSVSRGWRISISGGGSIVLTVYTDATNGIAQTQITGRDDEKWHHIAITYDDAVGRIPVIYIDGKIVDIFSAAATGNYSSDAGDDFTLFDNVFDGLIGWTRYSDNIRYAAEFVPPRAMPGADGNTVEQWAMNEGTGATAAATVTSPANDGAIANGTWEEQWDQETTPIVPYSVEFDGSATRINCGSDASIDDIQSGILYAEAWVRIGSEDDNKRVMVKGNTTTSGWVFNINSGTIQATIFCATDYATSQALHSTVGIRRDDKWYHILLAYNNGGDRKIYFAVNGIWAPAYDEQIAGNGAIVTDATSDLYLGSPDANTFEGAMGYVRLSNIARWIVGIDFTPPSRLNPPGTDGNTKAQYNFRDGPGAVLLDETANNNDGTITPGDGGWQITPDMEIDSPGERIFNWGYVIGNDAVDEGLTQILSGLDAGENYVVRTVASIESASRGRPKIIIYDETNGAEITSLEGPSYTGNHDGGAGVAALTDTTARFPQMLVGWTIYNITDGSKTTITAISGDMQTITGALGGGTDNDWDIGDEYRVVPPGGPSYYDDYPWIESFTFELPTIDRNGVGSDCVSISVKLVNGVNNGVIKWHQIELLENLLDNPSLETGAGNPWIPDGWANAELDAGDSEAEANILHSGVGSIEFNVGAINEGISAGSITGVGDGTFFVLGGWGYGDGTGYLSIGPTGANGEFQDGSSNRYVTFDNSNRWNYGVGVERSMAANPTITVVASSGGTGDRFLDDVYMFILDDVSLVVTPANLVNSAESGGLRVDGRDLCSQPIPAGILTATSGWIKFQYIPRHDEADVVDFGNPASYILRIYFDATHFIDLWHSLASRVDLGFNDGGGVHTDNWAPATLTADTEYQFEIQYNAGEMVLRIDGVTRITITTPINFANIPTIIYWGTDQTTALQVDAVFKAP